MAGKELEKFCNGVAVKPHDVVQVAFDLAGAEHAAVVSVDGTGQATLNWPLDGNTMVPTEFKALEAELQRFSELLALSVSV